MARYEIILKPEAIKDLDRLRKYDAATIVDGIERHLTVEPEKRSRSRIKKLRGRQMSDYRLRVGEFRVFYTVETDAFIVFVLRVLHKEKTAEFYRKEVP